MIEMLNKLASLVLVLIGFALMVVYLFDGNIEHIIWATLAMVLSK